MAANKDKIFIPTYQMERDAFYLLLRVRMETRGIKRINGVGGEFFAPETYKNGKKILASLVKKDLVVEQEGNILVREGLEKALDRILDSLYCMNFQNVLLHKKGQILTFYYADGAYVGVLLDKKETRVVSAPEEEILYRAFEKQLEDKSASQDFRPEYWDGLWRGPDASEENRGIQKPVREAGITHSGNRRQKENFHTALVADGRKVQVIRGVDSLPWKSLDRETVSVQDWYGVICKELKRLKTESQKKNGEGQSGSGKEDRTKEKSEYQQAVAAPNFPKSRLGFLFWSLKRIITGLPRMILGMVKKKSLALLIYPLWGVFLFFYNMYMTCYYNDTFMLDRRSRLGSLSPYLMAGTLNTPSSLKGLQLNWGYIDTSFLVWPLMMLLTLLGRQLILQLKQRKVFGFLCDLVEIPRSVKECLNRGYGKGRSMWIVLAAAWIIGFVIMNPITIFLSALLLLLMFAQGTRNGMVQLAFLWECAGHRKQIDAGQRPEPDSRKYRIMLFHGSMGMGLYGLVSLLLWFAVDYNWWIRLVVTVLMVLFAMMQVFMPGAMTGRFRSRAAAIFLFCLVALCAAAVFGGNAGVVFADDGGWSESGRTLSGLLHNAGFSAILGISLLTIGLSLGFPLAGVAIASLIVGGGTFLTGLTDTKAGDYVRKSARQYFYGPEDGENKTIFCTATELLNFAASFANPTAEMSGMALKVFQGGKLAGDVVSTIGDVASTYDDVLAYVNGSGNFGDLMWDSIGLALDIQGMKGDFDDFKHVIDTPGISGRDLNKSLRDEYQDIQQSRNSDISNLENSINSRRQVELDAENLRHQTKMEEIQNAIQSLDNGEIVPPAGLDPDTYRRALNDSLGAEIGINADNLSNIRDAYSRELQDATQQIMDRFSKEKREWFQNLTQNLIDHGYNIKDEWDNLKDFLTTNGFGSEEGELLADMDGLESEK